MKLAQIPPLLVVALMLGLGTLTLVGVSVLLTLGQIFWVQLIVALAPAAFGYAVWSWGGVRGFETLSWVVPTALIAGVSVFVLPQPAGAIAHIATLLFTLGMILVPALGAWWLDTVVPRFRGRRWP